MMNVPMTQRLKIALLHSEFHPRTGEVTQRRMHLIASGLTSLGHEVKLILLYKSPLEHPKNLPYQVVEIPGSSYLAKYPRFRLPAILRRYQDQTDIYHLLAPSVAPAAGLYRWLGGKKPVVVTLNSYGFCANYGLRNSTCVFNCTPRWCILHRPENLARKLAVAPLSLIEYSCWAKMANRVDGFIAFSPTVAEAYMRRGIASSKFWVQAGPVDLKNLDNAASRRRHVVPGNEYNILYVGQLHYHKGVDVLCRAMLKLGPDTRLHIVGDGPDRGRLESLCRELGLNARTQFHGWLSFDKVIETYLESQLFVHTARWQEPLPRTMLDAMAIGVPAIVSDCGGSAWFLGDGGLTFRAEDSEDLAEKIERLRADPSLAADLTKRAQKRVAELDWSVVLPKIVDIYRQVIEAGQK